MRFKNKRTKEDRNKANVFSYFHTILSTLYFYFGIWNAEDQNNSSRVPWKARVLVNRIECRTK